MPRLSQGNFKYFLRAEWMNEWTLGSLALQTYPLCSPQSLTGGFEFFVTLPNCTSFFRYVCAPAKLADIAELREIYAHAPSDPTASIMANELVLKAYQETTGEKILSVSKVTRKPIDSICPVCYDTMSEKEEIVWCQASCGNNVHKQCFSAWQSAKKDAPATCVYCRAPWAQANARATARGQNLDFSSVIPPEPYDLSQYSEYSWK